MIIHKDGKFKIEKDGTSYYRVYQGRKRIGSFLFLSEGMDYIELKKNLEKESIKMNSVENAQKIIEEGFKKDFENICQFNNKEINEIIEKIKEVKCLNCDEKQEIKENEIYQDINGKFVVCKKCDSSFDIEV